MSLYTVSKVGKNSLNSHLIFFCLLFPPVGFSHIRLQQQSANRFGLLFGLYSLGNILMEPFAMFIQDGFHVFSQKNLSGNAENEVSMTRYTHSTV
jgi:hypothetical protein